MPPQESICTPDPEIGQQGFVIHTKTMPMMTLMALCNKVNNYASTHYAVWQLVNKLTSRWWQWMMMMVIMLVVMVAKFLPFFISSLV